MNLKYWVLFKTSKYNDLAGFLKNMDMRLISKIYGLFAINIKSQPGPYISLYYISQFGDESIKTSFRIVLRHLQNLVEIHRILN